MTSVNTVNPQSISEIMANMDFGPAGSIQFSFAKLQMAQAQLCKGAAMDYMNQIENIQDEQKQTAEMISRMRQLQQEAKTSDKPVEIPDDIIQFCKERNLSLDTKTETVVASGKAGPWCVEEWAAKTWKGIIDNNGHVEYGPKRADGSCNKRWVSADFKEKTVNTADKDQLTYCITSFTNYQDSISNKTQTLMVFLQDYISQYNSFTQGASSQIANAAQVYTAVAKGQ